jgi:outer membrane lipoprotein SlyB
VLRFTEAELKRGRTPLPTAPVVFEGEDRTGEDGTTIGAGAVGGALGRILGGGRRAAREAAIGAAAGAAAALGARGRDGNLEPGQALQANVASPTQIRVPLQ